MKVFKFINDAIMTISAFVSPLCIATSIFSVGMKLCWAEECFKPNFWTKIIVIASIGIVCALLVAVTNKIDDIVERKENI